jgi:integrase
LISRTKEGRTRVRREALRLAELADLYLAEGPAAKPNKKASNWATDRSNIERHVKPLLGRKLATSLTHDDVVRFPRDGAAGKSKADVKTKTRGRAIVEGGPGTAARSLAVLGAMLEWAARPDRKLIPANPAKGGKLLAELPRRGDYVLPAAKGAGHYTGLQKDWERVRARAGLGGVRIHELRHSFASFAVANGNSLYLIGKLLGHKQARTTKIYAHLADDPIRAVADRTAARIAAAMAAAGERDPARIVPIHSSRA